MGETKLHDDRQNKPYEEMERVRGVLPSLAIALVVSFVFCNILYAIFTFGLGSLSFDMVAFVKRYYGPDYMFNIALVMIAEAIVWKSAMGAFTRARVDKSLWDVIYRSIFGSRGSFHSCFIFKR